MQLCPLLLEWACIPGGVGTLLELATFLFGEERSLGWGAWVAQSVERPTSAHVMISRFVGSSPASGSVLTAESLEPASDSVSPPLGPSPAPTLSLSQK